MKMTKEQANSVLFAHKDKTADFSKLLLMELLHKNEVPNIKFTRVDNIFVSEENEIVHVINRVVATDCERFLILGLATDFEGVGNPETAKYLGFLAVENDYICETTEKWVQFEGTLTEIKVQLHAALQTIIEQANNTVQESE